MAGSDKGRFESLDALRGVAALSVLGYHTQIVAGFGGPFSRAYLFVDLFFALSGFVIAHRYEPRFRAGLGFRGFMTARLIRLYPLIALGVAIGMIVALRGGPPGLNRWVAFACQLLLLPAPFKGWRYVLDGVEWSLSLELLANAAHVLVLARLSTRALAMLMMAAFAALIVAAAHYGSIGLVFGRSTAPGAIARVAFSYMAGMLAYRLHARGDAPRLQVPWWAGASVALILVLAAAIPVRVTHFSAVRDLMVVAAFPPLVYFAAGRARAHRPRRVASVLGDLSYPLYALHLPMLIALVAATHRLHGAAWGMACAAGLAAICAFAWAMLKFYDEPLRGWLKGAPAQGSEPAL